MIQKSGGKSRTLRHGKDVIGPRFWPGVQRALDVDDNRIV
jgi:hypothetical protein